MLYLLIFKNILLVTKREGFSKIIFRRVKYFCKSRVLVKKS